MNAAAKRAIGIFRSTMHLVLSILFVCAALPARAAETVTFFHNDVAGSPLAATDVNGFQVWKEAYRPYGDRLVDSSASANNDLWFSGKPFDEIAGLSYMGARYYDPIVGRFMGVDPAALDLQSLHAFNRYAYANNNPLKFNDPNGRESGCVSYNNCANVVLTPEAIGIVADLTPFINDIKGVSDAVRDPTALNIVAAGIGILPGVGDVASKTLKTGAGIVETAARAGAATTKEAAGTLKGSGNIGSHGVVDAGTVLSAGQKWLGQGYKEIAPGVFRSADGLRQFRMTDADLMGTHGKIGSHVHFEALNDAGKVIENLHLRVGN